MTKHDILMRFTDWIKGKYLTKLMIQTQGLHFSSSHASAELQIRKNNSELLRIPSSIYSYKYFSSMWEY